MIYAFIADKMNLDVASVSPYQVNGVPPYNATPPADSSVHRASGRTISRDGMDVEAPLESTAAFLSFSLHFTLLHLEQIPQVALLTSRGANGGERERT